MLITVTSASGAPGASTLALALALYRKDLTLLVEADPTGSSPTLSGYLRSEVRHTRSIKNLIDPDRTGRLRGAVGGETIRIPGTQVSVLPGLVHAGQAAAMNRTWPHLADQLTRYGESNTVIVDAGRMGVAPMPVMRRADLIIVVVRPTLPSAAALASALVPFGQDLAQHESRARLGLIVVGDRICWRDYEYNAHDLASAASIGIDLITIVPDSPRAARILSEGATMTRWQQRRSPYLLAMRRLWPKVEAFTAAHDPWAGLAEPDALETPRVLAAGGGRR